VSLTFLYIGHILQKSFRQSALNKDLRLRQLCSGIWGYTLSDVSPRFECHGITVGILPPIALNIELKLVPVTVAPAIIMTAINPASSPYSIAVAPLLSLTFINIMIIISFISSHLLPLMNQFILPFPDQSRASGRILDAPRTEEARRELFS